MAEKKGRKKLFVIAILALIIGGGVVGFQMFMGGDKGDEPVKIASSELGYIGLEPFLAPVIEGRRISKYVAVGVTLEVYDEDDKPLVYKYMTPLRNVFIDDFVFQAQMNRGTEETLHLRRIKSRFHNLAARIMGDNIVKEVLISHALDRGF